MITPHTPPMPIPPAPPAPPAPTRSAVTSLLDNLERQAELAAQNAPPHIKEKVIEAIKMEIIQDRRLIILLFDSFWKRYPQAAKQLALELMGYPAHE